MVHFLLPFDSKYYQVLVFPESDMLLAFSWWEVL